MKKDYKPELFEDEMITRIRGTHPNSMRAASTEIRTQVLKSDGEVPLIEHENITRKWSPDSDKKGQGSRLSLPLLGKIGNLCRCRIEYVGDSTDLFIKADQEQDIEKGISKLKRLSKMAVCLSLLSAGFAALFIGSTMAQILRENHKNSIADVSRTMR